MYKSLVNQQFPYFYEFKRLTTDEMPEVYDKLLSSFIRAESELLVLKENNKRLEHENQFMLKLINERIKE